MGKLIFITGGARSGKSTFAEKMAASGSDRIIYVATAKPIDEEMRERIRMHQKQRSDAFVTVEGYSGIPGLIQEAGVLAGTVLIDCITLMVCNLMFDIIPDWDDMREEQVLAFEKRVEEEITQIVQYAEETDKTVIVVTNEIGMGIVPGQASTRLYRDVAGRANQMLAGASKEAYLMVSSLPIRIK
ncbi:MAG: bifunctional adenosylcobinamide kinase/adenosylcobinamide-phosphate guanylyltransferase [Clostridia bacterium]